MVGAAPARAEPPQVIDRVVAAVEGRVITQSELAFETRVRLIELGGVEAATAPLDEALGPALGLLIAQRLLLLEADRLGAFPLEEQDSGRVVTQFRARFRSDAAYRRFLQDQDADEQALSSLLARKLRADRFLDSKVGLRAQVSEAEVARYFAAHERELSRPLDEVRGALREKLIRERYQDLVSQELKEARRTADVRFIAPFARVAGSAP